MRKLLLVAAVLFIQVSTVAHASRWKINPSNGITWSVEKGDSHYDQIEMAGEKMATVLRWGVNPDGGFSLERSLIFPMLRTIPNDTHASLIQRFALDIPSMLIVNGVTLNHECVEDVTIDGTLSVNSKYATETFNVGLDKQKEPLYIVKLKREITPSTTKAMLCERYTLENITNKDITIFIPAQNATYKTLESKGVNGSYTLTQQVVGDGSYIVKPNEKIVFHSYIEAYSKDEKPELVSIDDEFAARRAFVNQMWDNLILETPDKNVNTMFAFAKIRAAESIYKTEGGYMHGPGGERYYAAIWANDQAEYINPFFPYLGYDTGNKSAINSFRHFARFMNDEYKPIPSSIIAEGTDIWNGAGDRGDAAMIAHGATRYALASGSKTEAQELWPLIEWCLEYCNRKINKDGVVESDSDELEGRFPSGDANLCTSTLYYDALIYASYLSKELGKGNLSSKYTKQAKTIRKNIESYFGAEVEGYDTYQYYQGNDILRSWICMPLTVGIYDRAEQTIKALFSDRLWTKDGCLTQAGTATFWDRSTLYALRGVYAAGATATATDFLKRYSQTRLLGNHVPYAIEAYPEGGQRHLSAESALYCRIFTEGLFNIQPTGLDSFIVNPQLPEQWSNISLKNINAYGKKFDILVKRTDKGVETEIIFEGKSIKKGVGAVKVQL